MGGKKTLSFYYKLLRLGGIPFVSLQYLVCPLTKYVCPLPGCVEHSGHSGYGGQLCWPYSQCEYCHGHSRHGRPKKKTF
jgi:hypothetical protein